MEYIFLTLAIVFQAAQVIMQKQFNVSTKGQNDTTAYLFNVAITFSATVFFFIKGIVTGCSFEFHLPTFFYAIILGATYFCATIFNVLALRCGPLALSSLFLSYSLMIPTIYGIVFLSEPIKWSSTVGFLLLVVSIYLINAQKKEAKSDGKQKITVKWLILAVLTFISNGLCSTSIKAHQVAFPGKYSDQFMTYGLAIACALCFIAFLIKNSKNRIETLRQPFSYGVLCGVLNATTNSFDVYLSSRLAASLMYPVHSAGQIILTFLASFFIFREKFTLKQYVGLALGVASIVFLNL